MNKQKTKSRFATPYTTFYTTLQNFRHPSNNKPDYYNALKQFIGEATTSLSSVEKTMLEYHGTPDPDNPCYD
jgi:hypothetical protein